MDNAGTVISSRAAYGHGGMGQHFAHLVELERSRGNLKSYISTGCRAGDDGVALVLPDRALTLIRLTPMRFSRGWSTYVSGEVWDRQAAAVLSGKPTRAMAMAGAAGHFFRRARELGCPKCVLVSATAHIAQVRRQHAKARVDYPVEPDWLNDATVSKIESEYALADEIIIASDYAYQSFVSEGVPTQKLRVIHLPVAERFRPPPSFHSDGVFRIVYTGAVSMTKGIGVLIDAFDQLPDRAAELWLIGGTGTRTMRKWIGRAMCLDNRIRMQAGDPLPILQRASVYVHPSYQDGYGYAPMEALACGIPVIVTEDTGMREFVVVGQNGFVVPTGRPTAILQCLKQISSAPLRGTFAPPKV